MANQQDPGNKLEPVGLDLEYTKAGTVLSPQMRVTVSLEQEILGSSSSWIHPGGLIQQGRA